MVTDARLLFPSAYIAAADLKGNDVTLTISKVVVEALQMTNGKKESKPVVHFTEMAKRPTEERKAMVMNKTNMISIGKALGSYEIDDWIGKKITIFPTRCQFGRDTVDCIRVRE